MGISLRAANRAPRTVAQYVDESLAQFNRWLAERNPPLAARQITRQHVEAYLAEIAATRSPSTAHTRYKALRLLFAWAVEEGEVDANPMGHVRSPMVPDKPLPVLTDDELRALLAACSGRTFGTGATPPSCAVSSPGCRSGRAGQRHRVGPECGRP